MPSLPEPRGPITESLLAHLTAPPHPLEDKPAMQEDPLVGDDFQLALYVCYELHYRGFAGVDDVWEWEPSLLEFRRVLERSFEERVHEELEDAPAAASSDMAARLEELARSDDGPSLSRYIETRATAEQLEEFLIHRSAYQLKEADPHSWAIPRLAGRAKTALVEIQADEYGSGVPERMHAELFRTTMEGVGLDGSYGAYLNVIPGITLATVNLMSMFGLQRRWRGATVGHLALFEMTSSEPNRRYAKGLRRLGFDDASARFFDEHVEADSVHEVIAAHDLAGSLALDEPSIAADIALGARALLALDRRFAAHLLEHWSQGRSSLRQVTG
ncbi:iron-containing redox enzyme family protein [soil metagenome]